MTQDFVLQQYGHAVLQQQGHVIHYSWKHFAALNHAVQFSPFGVLVISSATSLLHHLELKLCDLVHLPGHNDF